MYFKGKNVLVTGGAGVIGRELIKELCNLKANVICIDKALRPDDISSEVQYIQKNILDLNTNEIVQSDPEIIFHLAATFERIEETPEFWDENFNDNILVGHKVVDAAIKCKSLKKFIFPSSYLVYSFNDYLNEKAFVSAQKLHETDYVNPRNLIGSSKYYTEKELDKYCLWKFYHRLCTNIQSLWVWFERYYIALDSGSNK